MKRLTALLLCFLLALSACSNPKEANTSSEFQLYFTTNGDYGPAIVSQPYTGNLPPSPQDLILALLAGPADDTLFSPFPTGLTLRGYKLENGRFLVDFSEQYSGLSDISLTLADYCLVLTLCQLDSISSVEITAAGSPVPHRSHQVLTPEEAFLTLDRFPSSS